MRGKRTLQITKPSEMKSSSTPADAATADAAADEVGGGANGSFGKTRGSTITFHEIHYSVQQKNPDKCCGSPTLTKDILTDIR